MCNNAKSYEMRRGWMGGTELNESEQGGGEVGPMQVGEDHDTVNHNAKMDTVVSPDGKQSDNFFRSSSLKPNQTLNEFSN